MFSRIKNIFNKYWRIIIIVLVSAVFFVGASSFNFYVQKPFAKDNFIKWLSPDETANYNLAKLYGQEGRLMFFEKNNLYVPDIIHPRSFRSDYGWLKPVSFLGIIIIFGKIASFTSYKIIPFLTPFFASLGIIFYYLLIKKIFGRKNAFLSAIILACFPVYIYYSARSMFHNVLFVSLLIIGLYFSISMASAKKEQEINPGEKPKKKTDVKGMVYAGLGGLFIGFAIITRTSELLWLGPALFITWLLNIKKIDLSKLLIFLSFMLLGMMPSLYYNQMLYGSFWRGGYAEMNQSILNITQAGTEIAKSVITGAENNQGTFTKIKNNIFYFGWYPDTSLKMFYHYFVAMFWWIFWPAVLGFAVFVAQLKKWKIKHWSYIIFSAITFGVLLLYYGSWGFHDNPNPGSFTIGNSYTRYWLPIYLAAIPFISLVIILISKIFQKKYLISAFRLLAIAAIFFFSVRFVLFGSEEGLVTSAKKQLATKAEYQKVMELTENNSVIITKYHDKLFFPERKVIVGLFDDKNMNDAYAKLVERIPVYYYNFTYPEKDFNYLNRSKLPASGLQIKKVAEVNDTFTLYKLSLLTPLTKGSPKEARDLPAKNKK